MNIVSDVWLVIKSGVNYAGDLWDSKKDQVDQKWRFSFNF